MLRSFARTRRQLSSFNEPSQRAFSTSATAVAFSLMLFRTFKLFRRFLCVLRENKRSEHNHAETCWTFQIQLPKFLNMFNIIDFNDRHHETDQTYSEVSRLCVCCTALCICQWMLRQEFCRIWYTSVIFIWFHETIALPQDYFRPCQMSSEYSFRVFPLKSRPCCKLMSSHWTHSGSLLLWWIA